jgi:hypothetical protein
LFGSGLGQLGSLEHRDFGGLAFLADWLNAERCSGVSAKVAINRPNTTKPESVRLHTVMHLR